MQKADVAIIGAGPAGAMCAIELTKRGLVAVLCMQPGRPPRPSIGEMLQPRAARLVENAFGISLPQSSIAVANRRTAWGAHGADNLDHLFWHSGPAYVVRGDELRSAISLSAQAAGAGFATLRHGQLLVRDGDCWQLPTQDGPLSARFVVEASGTNSRSPAIASAKRHFLDRLICRAYLAAKFPGDQGDAFLASGAEGWAYSVPTSSTLRLYAWFTDADLLGSCPWAQLRRTLGDWADIPSGPPARAVTTTARTSIRTMLWNGNWLAIGDAAWTLDPLSGDGIERAVTSGAQAGDALARRLSTGDLTPLRDHALASAKAFQSAELARRSTYSMVKDWEREPFWRRRLR
jgi:flavin-dependent dehydrogenase